MELCDSTDLVRKFDWAQTLEIEHTLKCKVVPVLTPCCKGIGRCRVGDSNRRFQRSVPDKTSLNGAEVKEFVVMDLHTDT